MTRTPNTNVVFRGPQALREYLDPQHHPMLPMVELPEDMNRFCGDGVRIYIKMPPPLSMKQFGALGMLKAAAARPDFKDKEEGWVPSSGNMGVVIGILGRIIYGLKRVYAVVPAEIATGKLWFLKVAGTKAILDDALPGKHDSMSYAELMGSAAHAIYFAQYADPSNTAGYHELFDQIWEQMDGDLKGISFGCGTSGLGNCMAECIEQRGSGALTIAAYSSEEDQLPGMRPGSRLKKVPLFDASRFDYAFEIETYIGYRLSYELCKHGLMLGPTSGAALEALFKALSKLKKEGKLEAGNYISIGHDTSLVVLDKYSTQLKKEDFTSEIFFRDVGVDI